MYPDKLHSTVSEQVPLSQLLTFVYNQINALLVAFISQPKREKREAKKEMECNTFIKVLSSYEKLQSLTTTPQMIKDNEQEVEKLSNDIQMYSAYDGVAKKSCEKLDPYAINQKVQFTKSSLGKEPRK